MKIDRIDHGNLTSTIKLTVEKEDYNESFEKAIKETRQKANIPGFRKGMVPKGLIKKMHGRAILEEKVWETASRSLFNFIEENKIHMLGEPLESATEQNVLDFNVEGEFILNFDIGYIEDLNIDIAKTELLNYKIDITEEKIVEECDAIANQFAESKSSDEISEKTSVQISTYELDENNEQLENGINVENTQFYAGVIKDQEIKDSIIGLKVGDELDMNIQKAFPNATEISSILSIEKDKAEKLDSNFHVTISSISEYFPAEKNKDLFKKAMPNKEIETLDDFHAELKIEIAKSYDQQSNSQFYTDSINTLMETKIELPVEFLKKWMLRKDKTQTAESIEKNWDAISKEWNWQLIKNDLVDQFELKASKEDIESLLRMHSIQHFIQNSYFPQKEELDNMINEMLENKETVERYQGLVLDNKLMTSLKEKAIIKEESISFEDFKKLSEKPEEQNSETPTEEPAEKDEESKDTE
ncbi:MAG: hypothetical protein HN704_13380 [Bacteroidetes bacterium]|jgi:trigger factor|nr:hypothetical protein [Bacteroidota bacterium]MBT6687662.1 hypothetical protein [Bacteroidota bacterium]MBT7142857.1 hypothetical protein [Bacteroidota bacterium]MBT7492589.1 hypothetical protein [Bacteroidota bacterium]